MSIAFLRHPVLAGALTVFTLGAQAQSLEQWLPSTAQVAPVLQASPQIQAARAHQQAQLQRARGLQAGTSEWTLRLSQQQRRVSTPQERFSETMATLERPLRLWGKADMDKALAEQDRETAGIALADALHEAGRQLLLQWFSTLRARADAESADRELQLARELDRQAAVRLRQGDISPLDARLAQADLQRAQAGASLAQAELARSQAQWLRLYPGLPAPQWPQTPSSPADFVLPPLSDTPEQALLAFVSHHHELRLLRSEARRQLLLAQRLERERWPDPTLGVYTARERAGSEQVLGFSVAMPLSGSHRESQALAALSEARALEEKVQQLERTLSADFEGRWHLARHQQEALGALREAASTQRQAADKSLMAYNLGEHSMTELIQNRRLANEQELARQRLQLDGLLNRAQLELDAHRLWDLDD